MIIMIIDHQTGGVVLGILLIIMRIEKHHHDHDHDDETGATSTENLSGRA